MLFASIIGFCLSDEPLPTWPSQYHLKGTWNIPAWQIRVPFEVDTDEVKGLQSDRSYTLEHNIHIKGYRSYSIQTSTEEGGHTCLFQNTTGDDDHLTQYLPKDDEENKWSYAGETVVLGKLAKSWTLSNDGGNYTFYVEKESGLPLRYLQDGISIRHSHPTLYIFDITEYSPFANASNFIIPSKGCRNADPNGPSISERRKFGIVSGYEDTTYKCDEFQPDPIDISKIANFSWRDVPNVLPPIRDQANCGSCWAHSATEAISAQLSLQRKGNVTASAQQMIDCVFVKNTTNACMGGEGPDGFGYYANHSITIASEEEYPYLGVSGYCQESIRNPLGKVKTCKNITRDENDRTINVLRALYMYGPLMIYINAPSNMYNYHNGIFDDDQHCHDLQFLNQTNHGVLLTGWKTFPREGKKDLLTYEIMNSWSPRWGDNGFAYISSENDCGVPLSPLLPIVEAY